MIINADDVMNIIYALLVVCGLFALYDQFKKPPRH